MLTGGSVAYGNTFGEHSPDMIMDTVSTALSSRCVEGSIILSFELGLG